MDSGEIPGESIVVSVPSSPGNVEGGIERQDPVTPPPIRKAWVDTVIYGFYAIMILLCAPLLLTVGPLLLVAKMLKRTVICAVTILLDALLLAVLPLFLVAKKWERVFILSCVAVSFDCLFLYIPIIDQENKCLGSDKRLRNIALVLRSITDIAFIFHILLLKNDVMDEDPKWDDSNKDPAKASWLSKKMPRLSIYIIVNFLAILPIPQVAIVVGFSKLGGSKHFVKQTIINVFLIFQYILRIFQIFLSIKNVGDTVGKLVKGSFYFLMYVLANHVLTAFWYFFSIQREISCWDKACRAIGECMPIYECGRNTSLNSTSISKLCPIDSPDATLFDFGMFLDILQSGNTSSTKFSTKFFYSF